MCGIVGLVSNSPVNHDLYDALTMLQHRGQDAAGIMTCDADGRLFLRKDNGLVRDVFRDKHMLTLTGNLGIGHVRYPTAGSSSSAEAQPFYVNSPYGLALAHNGNLTNSEPLKAELFAQDRRHINTRSDSEILLNIFAHELLESNEDQPSPEAIFQAVRHTHRRCQGAYAVVMLIAGFGLLAFRDPNGIRPLVYGKRTNADGTVDWAVASETVVLDTLGFKLERDVAPGEAVYITHDGHVFSEQCSDNQPHTPCLFEYVYFARPDSIIDGACVYQTRQKMGEFLAHKILAAWPDHDIDAVIPIPDTSRTSAAQLAETLGVRCREGFMKNRYIGRTFIMPGQTQRKKSVRQKLNPIEQEFAGKNVLLVDDSIVRGTTSQEIIQMARDAGANKVYFASAAPPVRHPNVYGIDMPSAQELVANNRTEIEIQNYLGADKLFYQEMEDLIRAVQAVNPHLKAFDDSVFTGNYVTKGIDLLYLNQLKLFRADSAKQNRPNQATLVEMHNNF